MDISEMDKNSRKFSWVFHRDLQLRGSQESIVDEKENDKKRDVILED
jgi:hypothetical protein